MIVVEHYKENKETEKEEIGDDKEWKMSNIKTG